MGKYIMIGMDVHDRQICVKMAAGRGEVVTRMVENREEGRRELWEELHRWSKKAGGAQVVMAYETSGQGYGLHDAAVEEGFTCWVLATTKIARSPAHRRRKTDEEDAQRILEIVRGHVLGGNEIPSVWIPDHKTREDRELVRARLDIADKIIMVKTQMQTLLKRHEVRKPVSVGTGWTERFVGWLESMTGAESSLPCGARSALATLLRQYEMLNREKRVLDKELQQLAEQPRYQEPVRAMIQVKGVGMLATMVMLTDVGDLRRFRNRRQIAAYLGVVPSSSESGETDDRKGHITHQGPSRVRRVLCQCVWSRIQHDVDERKAYDRIVGRNPKHAKIAVVALIRRLAILLWHLGAEAQMQSGCLAMGI